MIELFTGIIQEQQPGHCGPTSLSACMSILGADATPRQLARAAGKPYAVYTQGLDEFEIRRAARRFGVRCEFLARSSKAQGSAFARGLCAHLERGLPALLLVSDMAHWVAVIGWLGESEHFVIMDPNDERAFNKWSEHTLLANGWNEDQEGDEPSTFFAILTSRADGAAPRWRISPEFLRLCARGSDDTAGRMARDLAEMVVRRAAGAEAKRTVPLGGVLESLEPVVLDSINHWARYSEVGAADLRRLFRDYRVVADAADLRAPSGVDRSLLAAQLTSVLSAYAWTGEL